MAQLQGSSEDVRMEANTSTTEAAEGGTKQLTKALSVSLHAYAGLASSLIELV